MCREVPGGSRELPSEQVAVVLAFGSKSFEVYACLWSTSKKAVYMKATCNELVPKEAVSKHAASKNAGRKAAARVGVNGRKLICSLPYVW